MQVKFVTHRDEAVLFDVQESETVENVKTIVLQLLDKTSIPLNLVEFSYQSRFGVFTFTQDVTFLDAIRSQNYGWKGDDDFVQISFKSDIDASVSKRALQRSVGIPSSSNEADSGSSLESNTENTNSPENRNPTPTSE